VTAGEKGGDEIEQTCRRLIEKAQQQTKKKKKKKQAEFCLKKYDG